MKCFGRCNIRKHKEIRVSEKYVTLKKNKEIRGSDNYVTLDISSKFESLNKIKITSSEPKGKLERSRKGVDYLSGFKYQIKVT